MKSRVGVIVVLVGMLVGCSAPKVMVSHRQNAENAELTGDYSSATASWQLFFEQQLAAGSDMAPEVYARAARSAYRANQFDLAENWYSQARLGNFADRELFLNLASIYNQQQNLSKELQTLESYHENYPENPDSAGVATRLFEIYETIGNEGKAAELWPLMKAENRSAEKYLDKYFSIQRKLKNDAVADTVAEELLALNPKHVKALEWLGEKYYRQAEERYQREMKAYEKNRTHLQHHQLLQELKLVNADFQKSLRHFEVLWEMGPNSQYAAYMVNIYTRFENPEKANYYRKYIE
ncbi:MAG: tetratricopeptide repeat protein [Mangrovibacterium sp.]